MSGGLSQRLLELVRRAILDLVEDTGGELSDETITIMLNEVGYRVSRRDVRAAIAWLSEYHTPLVRTEDAGNFIIATSTPDGRDVARGRLRVDGVSRHKTGE